MWNLTISPLQTDCIVFVLEFPSSLTSHLPPKPIPSLLKSLHRPSKLLRHYTETNLKILSEISLSSYASSNLGELTFPNKELTTPP